MLFTLKENPHKECLLEQNTNFWDCFNFEDYHHTKSCILEENALLMIQINIKKRSKNSLIVSKDIENKTKATKWLENAKKRYSLNNQKL